MEGDVSGTSRNGDSPVSLGDSLAWYSPHFSGAGVRKTSGIGGQRNTYSDSGKATRNVTTGLASISPQKRG